MVVPQELQTLIEDIEDFLHAECVGYDVREGYSGRGMFGRTSRFAVVAECGPSSHAGLRLQQLGMAWDNMGLRYVYYLTR